MSKIVNGINYIGIDDNGSSVDYTLKTIEIGGWDMWTDATKLVPHGLSSTEWKTIINLSGDIRGDSHDVVYPISARGSDSTSTATSQKPNLWFQGIASTYITTQRLDGSILTIDGDYSGTSVNRGFISFLYRPDTP